jgi:hypothetical protein
VEDPSRTRFMPPKRKRNALVGTNGIVASGKSLTSCWGWVSSEVRDVDNITLEHRITASNLSLRNGNPFCQNKYAIGGQEFPVPYAASPNAPHVNGELSEDVIVVSDADEPVCAKRACKSNPYCLNYLGQEMWEDEGKLHPRLVLLLHDFRQMLHGKTLSKLRNLVKILHFFPEKPMYL